MYISDLDLLLGLRVDIQTNAWALGCDELACCANRRVLLSCSALAMAAATAAALSPDQESDTTVSQPRAVNRSWTATKAL